VPAIKLPSAALIKSNQLMRESMSREDGTQKMRVACFVFVLVFDYPINFIVAIIALILVLRLSRCSTDHVHEHDHGFVYYQCLSISSRQNFNVDSTSSSGASPRC
jgi:hypothetical protein